MFKQLIQAGVSLCVLYSLTAATAETPGQDFASFSHDQALAHSQAAIGSTLESVVLTKTDGSAVDLTSYRGKPLVISMIYSSCHHVCPSTTQYLNEVVKKARSALGADSFHVVSVGFDTAEDTPERMMQFRQSTAVMDANWDFLSGDASAMAALSEQLGFIYYPSPKGFEHLVQSTVIGRRGEIYRQVYGINFDTPLLIEPLKDLVFDTPKAQSAMHNLGNRIRLFCTVYDPATDSYRIDISVFIGTFVGLIVSILFARVLVKEWRRSLKAGR
ncbi:MAG: SCO family protein [Halioglobus sp.]